MSESRQLKCLIYGRRPSNTTCLCLRIEVFAFFSALLPKAVAFVYKFLHVFHKSIILPSDTTISKNIFDVQFISDCDNLSVNTFLYPLPFLIKINLQSYYAVIFDHSHCTRPKMSYSSPPITLLQEICSRNGFTPEYQLLSTEGSVHEPTFKIAVTVDNITVTASGQSKKKARHAAAKEAIVKIRERGDINLDGINFESIESESSSFVAPLVPVAKINPEVINEANPVGKLQEICMKMRVNPPDYNTCDEKGLAHERIFILSCSIMGPNGFVTTLGEGRSKKLAKREAAEKMLIQLEHDGFYDYIKSKDYPMEVSSQTGNQTSPLNIDSDETASLVDARRRVTELCSRLDSTVEELWRDIKMIEVDTIQGNLYDELFTELMLQAGYTHRYQRLSDKHALLHVVNPDGAIAITSSGVGPNEYAARKEAVISAYKIMIVFLAPESNKDLPPLASAGIPLKT